MKKKEFNTTKEKTAEILKKEVLEIRNKITKTRMNLVMGKEKNLKVVSNLRRDLSQILTIIREKVMMEESSIGKEKGKQRS